MKGECVASGSPKDPEFEIYDEYPLTSNDPEVTAKVAAAFADYFGDEAFTVPAAVGERGLQRHPGGLRRSVHLLGARRHRPEKWRQAEAAGRLATDIPANHSPKFAPVIEPTLEDRNGGDRGRCAGLAGGDDGRGPSGRSR